VRNSYIYLFKLYNTNLVNYFILSKIFFNSFVL
jgi:hypothetical protein